MSTVPADIAGIGSTSQKLRVSPGFDPLKAAVGPDEYFLLSRIDGVQSLRDVLLATGLPVDRGIAIVQRLRSIGALLLPGEASAPAPASAPRASTPPVTSRTITPAVTPRTMTPLAPPTGRPGSVPLRPAAPPAPAAKGTQPPQTPELAHDLRLSNPTKDELAALSEDNVLSDAVRRRVLAMQRLLAKNDPHGMLGVASGADARTLKRAYFALSKEIHPDRYYGKKVGTFGDRMAQTFEAATRAYARLTGSDKARPVGSSAALRPTQDQPQTPTEYAAELFDRACQLEIGGDPLGAMKLFAAAVRVDPQLRYLRRAASCALAADQPRSAVEYAKKANALAPNDLSSVRLLAAAFRAAGKLSDAEEVLVMAMAMKNQNDVLTAELRNDLAEVRRLLATP